MTPYEITMIVIGALNVVVIGGGLWFAARKFDLARKGFEQSLNVHRANHDFGRRLAAQRALREIDSSVSVSNLQSAFNYLDRTERIPLEDLQSAFDGNDELKKELHTLLNFYEGLARGIQQQVYDEKVVKLGRMGAMTRAFDGFYAYIEYRRQQKSPRAWKQMESLVNDWKNEETAQEQRDPAVAGE